MVFLYWHAVFLSNVIIFSRWRHERICFNFFNSRCSCWRWWKTSHGLPWSRHWARQKISTHKKCKVRDWLFFFYLSTIGYSWTSPLFPFTQIYYNRIHASIFFLVAIVADFMSKSEEWLNLQNKVSAVAKLLNEEVLKFNFLSMNLQFIFNFHITILTTHSKKVSKTRTLINCFLFSSSSLWSIRYVNEIVLYTQQVLWSDQFCFVAN